MMLRSCARQKGWVGEFGGTGAMGQAESVLGQVQPGEGVEYLVIVIGLTAGGNAAQQRGRGGHGFAAHPFDEGKGVLRPFLYTWTRPGNRLR